MAMFNARMARSRLMRLLTAEPITRRDRKSRMTMGADIHDPAQPVQRRHGIHRLVVMPSVFSFAARYVVKGAAQIRERSIDKFRSSMPLGELPHKMCNSVRCVQDFALTPDFTCTTAIGGSQHLDRDRQAERHRSPSLASPCPRPLVEQKINRIDELLPLNYQAG